MHDHPQPKPWYRLRNIVLLCVLLVFGFVGYQVYMALTATPGSSVDYGQKLVDLASSVSPGADRDDNAFPHIRRAMKLRDEARQQIAEDNPGVERADGLDFALIYTPFDPENPTALGNFSSVEEYEVRRNLALQGLELYRKMGVFDAVAEAGTKSRNIRPKAEGRLLDLMLPDLGGMRDIARANAARMRLARTAGDAPEFVEAFEQTMGLGRVATADPILISNLVGIALVALSLNELRDAILAGDLPPGSLEGVANALERHARFQPASLGLKGEHISTLDIIQWTHTDNGHGDGRRILSIDTQLQANTAAGVVPPKLRNLAAIAYPGKREVTRVADTFYAKVVEYADMDPAARRNSAWHPDTFSDSLSWRQDLLKLLIPALSKAISSNDQVRADVEGSKILVAIERSRAARGSLPPDLNALVPEFLPALPKDGYAADGAFRYRVLPAPDEHGRTYLLYSVGPNGNDDGGVESAEGETRPGQPTPLVPTDAVINRIGPR
jgi:hypothetical protein